MFKISLKHTILKNYLFYKKYIYVSAYLYPEFVSGASASIRKMPKVGNWQFVETCHWVLIVLSQQ